MKDACEECGVKPEIPEDDLVECQGCGKTICVNDCVWGSTDSPERYWCYNCVHGEPRESK